MRRVRVTPEAACAMLREQIDELDQFRNASTRDASFKQWRQSTLTAIQRIWPGVTARSSRFRRIPFSPPSTLADARQSREAFERGCAEATILVRAWVAEIETHGIVLEDAEGSASQGVVYGAPVLSLDQEIPRRDSGGDPSDPGVPTIDLPRSDAGEPVMHDRAPEPKAAPRSKAVRNPGARADSAADRAPAHKAAKPSKPARSRSSSSKPGRLKDMLGLGHLSAASGGPDESQRFQSAADAAQAAFEAAAPAHAAPPAIPPVADRPPVPAATPASKSPSPAVTAPVAPIGGEASKPPGPRERDPFDFSPAASEEPALTLEVVSPGSHPAFSMAVPFKLPQASSPPMERLEVSDLELTVVNGPISPPAPPPPQDLEGAAEIARIAGEIGRYDVPAAESERVRRALLDLAGAIERGESSWDALRAATVVVMHYPKLGRRTMPVLLPLLDRTG